MKNLTPDQMSTIQVWMENRVHRSFRDDFKNAFPVAEEVLVEEKVLPPKLKDAVEEIKRLQKELESEKVASQKLIDEMAELKKVPMEVANRIAENKSEFDDNIVTGNKE